MFHLKKLSDTSIESALEKATRYRLLNDPEDAASICRDVLMIAPDNQEALVTLTLALTDQFHTSVAGHYQESVEIVARMESEYEREYYAGIVSERRAKAICQRGTPSWGCVAYDWFRRAMESYERAEKLRPRDNDDALLRWNSCARIIMQTPEIKPEESRSSPLELE